MSGQPTKTQADANKFRNEYLETLALQESINDMNLQANKTYLATGQLPPQSQMPDTRTSAEKLADIERLKQDLASNLRPIAEPNFAYQIINKIIDSPMNLDNSLFRFFAQRAPSIVEQIRKLMPYGIAGDINDLERIYDYIKNMYSDQQGKFQSTKSYLNSVGSQSSYSRVLSGNDMDLILQGFQEIIKNLNIVQQNIYPPLNGNIYNLTDRILQIIMNLKDVLPTTEQTRLLLQDIENPNFNNPYDDRMARVQYNREDMTAFFKLIEKLPRYNDVMALLTKIKQFISSQNWTTVNDGLTKLLKLFTSVDDIQNRALLNKFRDIKQRQEFKQEVIGNLEAEQTRAFIRQQTEDLRDASRAQKVYIVNPQEDAVWVRGFPTGQEIIQTQSQNVINYGKDQLQEETIKKTKNPIQSETIPPQFVLSHDELLNQKNKLKKSFSKDDGLENIKIPNKLNRENIVEHNKLNYDFDKIETYDYINSLDKQQLDELTLKLKLPIGIGRRALAEFILAKNKYDNKKSNINDVNKIMEVLRTSNKGDGSELVQIINSINQKYNLNLPIDEYKFNNFTTLTRAFDELNKLGYNLGDLGIHGLGIKRSRGRPRGGGIVKVPVPKVPNFIGFGINEINQKQLKNGIVKIRRNTGTNYMDMPSKRVSKNLQGILTTIVGGGVPKFEELTRLDEDEKEYLNKLVSRSNLSDRLTIPAPSKDQQEKDIHNFEVMKGQIMSGNDNVEMVKKFKLLMRKLTKQGLLPKNDVEDIIDTLTDLGY